MAVSQRCLFSSSALAAGAEECRTLGLYDSLDRALARAARFAGAIVNPVVVLVPTGLIERVAVRAVGES